MQSMMRIRRHLTFGMLLLEALLWGCALRPPAAFTDTPSKVTLDEAQSRLEHTKRPLDRTMTYIQISDILLRHVRTSVPLKDTAALTDWLDQYRHSILSAEQAIVNSGRDAQYYPQGYMDLEMTLRQHIRWLNDWRGALIDQQRKPIDETMTTAVAVRQQMLDLLFPVQRRDSR